MALYSELRFFIFKLRSFSSNKIALCSIPSTGEKTKHIEIAYERGDSVRIIDGPLEDFVGIVQEVEAEKNYVKVNVSMFGRDTPVELELDQVEPVD